MRFSTGACHGAAAFVRAADLDRGPGDTVNALTATGRLAHDAEATLFGSPVFGVAASCALRRGPMRDAAFGVPFG